MTAFLLLLHGAITFTVALRIIYARHSGSAALAWLAVLFAFPVFGVAAYLLIGEPKLGRNRAKRLAEITAFYTTAAQKWLPEHHIQAAYAALDDPRWRSIARFGYHTNGLPAGSGNRTQILSDTDTILHSMAADIAAAQHSCLLEFYIIDPQGRIIALLEAVEAAAQRGVRCRLLADALGSAAFWRSAWPQRLRLAGAEVCEALPIGVVKALWQRSDLRNHRKILIIDHQIAYTGSYNPVDPALFKQGAGVGEWVDAMMRIEGSAAAELSSVLYADWAVENDRQLQEILAELNTYLQQQPEPAHAPAQEGALLQVFPSAPGGESYPLYDMLVCALHNAQHSVVMTTPYFIPDDALLDAMTTAARRGVDVVLIIPEKVDSLAVRYAAQTYFPHLLRAGVRVERFCGGLLHTKSVVVDDNFALFGTVNMDMRSFYLNLEIALAVYDRATVAQIAALQQSYLAQCCPAALHGWQNRHVLQRFAERCVRLASPLL